MPSPLVFVPKEAMLWEDSQGRPIAIAEVTVRCLQGLGLLHPNEHSTSLLLGVIGRAQAMYDFELFGYAYLSNHGSMLVGIRSADHLRSITCFIHGNIARELGRKENSNWSGKFWGRSGRPILILSDEDLEDRMSYLLSNSTKEDLVKRPQRWPGAHCARALCNGTTDRGLWINRTELRRLKRNKKRKERVSTVTAEIVYDVNLAKLACRRDLSDEEYRNYISALCRQIATDAEAVRAEKIANGEKDVGVLGVKAILRAHPHDRLGSLKKSPAPRVHCKDPQQKRRFLDLYKQFLALYRIASAALRGGIGVFEFPPGGIPPGCCLHLNTS